MSTLTAPSPRVTERDERLALLSKALGHPARVRMGEIEGLRICYWANRERLAELPALLGDLIAGAVEADTDACD